MKAKRLFVLSVFALFSMPALAAAPTDFRDPWLWPFSADSPWNTPIGNGAQFAPDSSPATADVVAGNAEIHAGTWSHPVYLASEADPLRTVIDVENNRSFQAHIPLTAHPDPMRDAHMYVIDPAKAFSLEMYGAKPQGDGSIIAVRAFRVSVRGSGMHLSDGSRYPGVRAMDASGFGGLIRAWEIRDHHIAHALTFLLPYSRLRHGFVWPSGREDYWGFREYKGNVPIGALIGIPPSVDITKLGLNPGGLALAQALQDYGAYCDDSSGSNGIIFSAEGAAENLPELAEMRRDVARIHPYLRPVTNNTPATPGGGGTPRRPPAPPLAQ